jgi:hypothetical protein
VKLIERTFELRGTEGLGKKPKPGLIGPVLERVPGALLDTVRMGFLHSSHARGRVPECLRRAADIRYIGHSAGSNDSTILGFEVPQFGSVAEELFEQGQLWSSGPKPEQTAFDLLSASLHDVRQMTKNSERFDHAMLVRFASYRKLLHGGLTSIALPDGNNTEESIDEQLSAAAESLFRETPPARRVRLCGRLDSLAVSRRVLGFFLEDGTPVTAVWTNENFVDLAKFLNKQILIEGLAEFRPSGTLLRVDADAIRDAGAGDSSFSTLPLPEVRRNYQKIAATVRPGQKPYAAIFGLIPGDESEESFATAVAELS